GSNAPDPGLTAGSGAPGASDAASPFGNASAGAVDAKAAVVLIDDGGLALLPDGATLYAKFWARPCPSGSTLSYENFGSAFFAQYCLRCHSATKQGADRNDAPATLNFDQLDAVRANAERIWGQAGDSNTTMPAGAPRPTPAERAELGEWLACGARGGDAASH
ncbi:MAG: hypothetical protein ACHQ53_09800, partial [Polyangiales bacterium]